MLEFYNLEKRLIQENAVVTEESRRTGGVRVKLSMEAVQALPSEVLKELTLYSRTTLEDRIYVPEENEAYQTRYRLEDASSW
jgi:hypothetical protein